MTIRFLPFVAILAAVAGCTKATTGPVWPESPKPKVLTTFAPIACFVANVAGDDCHVKSVMSSQGPHDFDPTPADASAVAGADLFFVNGLELDTRIAEKMKNGSGNKNLKIIELGAKIDEKLLLEGECHHDHAAGEKHEAHEHGLDPHVWLGPDLAILMVHAIRDELKRADPSHAAEYERRSGEYTAKLVKLMADGKAMLGGKTVKIVTMHESMGYFARAFDVDIVGSIQATPGQEPTRKKLDELIGLIEKKNVTILAAEPQYGSSNAVKAIQRELKAKGRPELQVIELDPIETGPAGLPPLDFYETKLRANLAALAAVVNK
jgi:zinc transport system substrate-binding protein